MTSFHRASELVLASNRGDRKTNTPADFSPAGGNLFNVSSVGLDRHPEGRADHWGQGCRPPSKSAKWNALVPIPNSAVLFQPVMQYQLAPGSGCTSAASAAGTVRMMREPETLTGIEYCTGDPPVSAGRRSKNTPLNAVPSQSAYTRNSGEPVCPGGDGKPGGSVEGLLLSPKFQKYIPPDPGGLGSASSEPATSTVHVSVSEIVNDPARMSRNAGASCPLL